MNCPHYGHWVSLRAMVAHYNMCPRKALGLVAMEHASLKKPVPAGPGEVVLQPNGRWVITACPELGRQQPGEGRFKRGRRDTPRALKAVSNKTVETNDKLFATTPKRMVRLG